MTPDAPTARPDAPDGMSPEAAFWKARYEEERLRLAKLLLAYKDLEAELRALTPAPAPTTATPPAPGPVVAPASAPAPATPHAPALAAAPPEPTRSITPA